MRRLSSVSNSKSPSHRDGWGADEDFQLFPHMTVFENLVYAPKNIFKNKNVENDKIKLGLIEPEKPKLKIGNMAIVMKN